MEQQAKYRILLQDRHWDISISDRPEDIPQIIQRNGNHLIIRDGQQQYQATVISEDPLNKRYEISINGRQFTLQLQTPLDVMIADMGLNRSSKKASNSLNAPMPGMVLELRVQEGDHVEEGSPLLILEAMKMENVLKSGTSTKVAKILVEKGQAVEKGQPLIEFE